MPTPKLDFDLDTNSGVKFGNVFFQEGTAHHFIFCKLKQLCQAVDALNERLDANTKGFIEDIAALKRLISMFIKIQGKLNTLENIECHHEWVRSTSSGLTGNECSKCGKIQ